MIETTAVLLDKMSGFDFEELVADILNKLGYGHIEQVLYTQDGGRDILIHSPSGLIVVECKHQPKTSIGRPIVQKLHSAVVTSKAVKGILVTTGRFTKEALEYANNLASTDAPIEMVDKPILIDMACRANVKLVSGKQQLSVWSYELPSEQQTIDGLSTFITSNTVSYPRPPASLLNKVNRTIDYRPVYSIIYRLNSTFETSVGVIHQENVSRARLIIDGTTGRLLSDNISKFLETEQQVAFYQPHPDFKGVLPTFKVDNTTMHNNAKKMIIQKHTTTVSYSGLNNHSYRKECVPSERDLYIIDIRQLYLPSTRINFKLGISEYYTEGAQATSGKILSETDNLKKCKICNSLIEENGVLCDTCGKITHSGGFLIRSIHGYKCNRCGRTTCREHGYWRRKYLIIKVLLCPFCCEQEQKDKHKFKRFDAFKPH